MTLQERMPPPCSVLLILHLPFPPHTFLLSPLSIYNPTPAWGLTSWVIHSIPFTFQRRPLPSNDAVQTFLLLAFQRVPSGQTRFHSTPSCPDHGSRVDLVPHCLLHPPCFLPDQLCSVKDAIQHNSIPLLSFPSSPSPWSQTQAFHWKHGRVHAKTWRSSRTRLVTQIRTIWSVPIDIPFLKGSGPFHATQSFAQDFSRRSLFLPKASDGMETSRFNRRLRPLDS